MYDDDIQYGNEVNAHTRTAFYNTITNFKSYSKTEQFGIMLEQNTHLISLKYRNAFNDISLDRIKQFFSQEKNTHFNPKSIILASVLAKNVSNVTNINDVSSFDLKFDKSQLALVKAIKKEIKEFDNVDETTVIRDAIFLIRNALI